MRIIKLWDASDQEILIDMDRKGKPIPYKQNKLIEFVLRFIVFIISGRR